MLQRLTDKTPTNLSYRAGQFAFLKWCQTNNVDVMNFTASDLTNFLSFAHLEHHLAPNTVKLWRSAVSQLHPEPTTLSNSTIIRTLIQTILSNATPIEQHQDTIDITPTIHYIRNIASSNSTAVGLLQQKVAFLLGMAAFLRPSDLHRIPRSSVIFLASTMKFKVYKPKEKRQAIKSLLRHPKLAISQPQPDRLFLNSRQPTQALEISTIRSYLRKAIKKSTNRSVSVRSLASTIARQQGISIQDIVTQGNWSSETVYDTYYRRDHINEVDITNAVLS
ncbi:hypothetical protein EDC96DRAFT_584591, partial [Choanephora cucurbitarum]